ncbi:DnaB-like helicase C-terminal domain-containing protein [Mycoplasmopsis columbinasalis]|uniref:Replicative DNA helicase n=1 Tax=Mycoplasmopsis columbinasalis TaxID=114880 RepID=A0A449B9R2_9BACT|nr:DnaB-like helicase C-terminal domain-containing protein [Mycoplasmopsis columbinasalis]VEU77894.1 Replicative DNA helicase [Mycoplasmopsis columbinasalis]
MFDAYNQGLAKGSLIVLGARPGVGKTAFALNLIAAVAHKAKGRLKRPLNVLLISLEMHRKEIMARLFAHLAQIPITNFSEQTWKDTAENKARMEFALNFINLNLNLLIAEQSLHEQSDIDAFVKFIPLINLKHPLDLVIVDHLQHLHYPNETLRTYEVGKAVDTFKQIAKENQIPIILLFQLNRESVQEQTLPTLKHLKDSASIEAAADQIILLSKSKHKLSNGNFVDICFFNMAKNRANSLTDSYMVFNGETLTFKELKK